MAIQSHRSEDSVGSTSSANRDTGFPPSPLNMRAYSTNDSLSMNHLAEQNSCKDLMDSLVGSPVSFVRRERHDGACPGSPLTRAFAKKEWWLIAGEDIDFGDEHEILGEGSVSIVFKAQLDGEDVAVKVLRTDHEGDRDEAGLPLYGLDLRDELSFFTTKQSHPSIIDFKGAGSVFCLGSVVPMIVYEFLAGSVEDLFAQRSREKGDTWEPPSALGFSWAQQLFSAVDFLHTCDMPVAHRDLKLANILLSGDLETLKVADFSLATPLKKSNFCSEDCTTIPSLAGSFRYMAPEVAQRIPFDLAAADVYSASITAWSLIHGRRPFDTIRDAKTALSCVCGGLRPVVKDSKLRALLEAGWAADPRVRATASEMEAMIVKLRSKKSWSQKVYSKVKKSFTRVQVRSQSPEEDPRSGSRSPLRSGSRSPLRGIGSSLAGLTIKRISSAE